MYVHGYILLADFDPDHAEWKNRITLSVLSTFVRVLCLCVCAGKAPPCVWADLCGQMFVLCVPN